MRSAGPLAAWVTEFGDPDVVFAVSAALLGVGQAVTSLEYLSIRREFGSGGLYSWPVLRLFAPARSRPVARARDAAFGARGTSALFVVRLLLSCVLVVGSWCEAVALPVVVLLATLLVVFNRRLPWGREAADDLSVHVAIGLAVYAVCRACDARSLGLYYVAAYVGLVYVTAGVTKLSAPAWRNGEALLWVVNLQSFGSPGALALLAPRPRVRRALSWAVIFGEIGAPLVVLLPAPAVGAAVVVALGFHLTLAFVMGLNTFVWAFAATYPAVLLVWAHIH